MSETTETAEQAVPPGALLLDYYEQLWRAEQAIARTETVITSVSPNQTIKKIAEQTGYSPSHAYTLPHGQLRRFVWDTLSAHFAYTEAGQELADSIAERDEILESIEFLSPKIIGKTVVAGALEDYPDAIHWQRAPFPGSQFMAKSTPTAHAKGEHLMKLPTSLDEDIRLELYPSGPRSLWGSYGVMLLDNNCGSRMVELTVVES